MNKNKLIVAAAGSGKTSHIIKEALKISDKNVLITTYTNNNEEAIKKKIINKKGCIPGNVTIQPWYSFLLQHGARPYQGGIFDKKIRGINLINGRSALFTKESDTEKFYFDQDDRAYPDKLPKFVLKCNKKVGGRVIDRISKIFPYIFIDEIQDLAGYDLDVLKLLFDSSSHVVLVGDPRQTVYSTNQSARYEKYREDKMITFFESEVVDIEIDKESLVTNYRSNAEICTFSNQLFSEYGDVTSGQSQEEGMTHSGVFLVRENDIDHYLSKHDKCMQLYYSNREKRVRNEYPAMTFGKSKGLTFDRVLIFPTKGIADWLADSNVDLSLETRCKFYVAVTRAKYSVAIVCSDEKYNTVNNDLIKKWESNKLFGVEQSGLW